MAERNDYKARRAGAEHGTASASWVEVENADQARWWVRGFEDGDPATYDIMPWPLSGEWAGESVPELSDRYGIPLDDDAIATEFEQAFSSAWEAEVVRMARLVLEDDSE
jgi:hypothetical protein